MNLSRESFTALSDLIENKLSIMTVGDRDDLREKIALRKALSELQLICGLEEGVLKNFNDIPRRGRRRKVADMITESGMGEAESA